MAKSKKTDADQLLEQPAGEAVAGPDVPKIEWPASTEVRELGVNLTDEETHEQTLIMLQKMDNAETLAQEKKATAKDYDSRISAVEEEITKLIGVVREKKIRREVPCHWVFEANGIDADGVPKFHSGMKTLFRDDSGEVVESIPITVDDRQMILPIGDEEAHQHNISILAAQGFTVMETPDGNLDHDGSFQALSTDGLRTIPLYADSLAEAAAQAVSELAKESETAAA